MDIGAFQANLVVETTDRDRRHLRRVALPPATVDLANQFPGDTISFAPGLSGTIASNSPLPAIMADLTIDGPGAVP